MKIKNLGWSTFQLSIGDITVLTDPLALKDSGLGLPKSSADVVLFTDSKFKEKENIIEEYDLIKKVTPDHRESIFEISSPGEFEIGGVMIRRDIDDSFYIIDETKLRVVYMGLLDNSFDINSTKNLGDVDVLILPIGNGSLFVDYDKIEKILTNLDPSVLLPCAYKKDGLKIGKDIKSREDFIKHFGFTNVKDETYLNMSSSAPELEQKNMEVIFLN
ncbi:MAG: MBL fold metallo-hydrolase [Candidatus Dojkabacteria bacterium]|jgi:L-ascorbate metabolism protein UlaG (beta-lactamase superfamily)